MLPVFVFLCFFAAVTPLAGVDVDIPRKGLPVGVKSVTAYTYENEDGKLPVSTVRYDNQRRKQKKKVYTDEGKLRWTITYRYNDKGRIKEKEAIGPNEKPVWRIQYKYDSQERLLQEIHYNANDYPEYTMIHEYQDERTETLAYGPEGSVRWRRKIIDDKERNIREIFYYYPDGNRIKGIIKEFDNNDRLFKEIHIDEIGAIFRRIETEYNSLGRITERHVLDHRGETHRKVLLTYLPNGHPADVHQVFPQQNREEEISYEYKFDNRGAWIQRETTVTLHEEDDKKVVAHTIEYRDIEYYQYTIGENR